MPKSPSFNKEPLRICVISFMFAPLVGGAEAQAEKHARQLQALGHEAMIMTLRHSKAWPKYEVLDGLPIVRVNGIRRRNGWLHIGRFGHPFIDIAMFCKLLLLRQSYDVVHVMQLSSMSAIATLVCKLTRKPIIISIQSAGPNAEQRAQLKHGVTLMADTITTIDPTFLKVQDDDWVAGDIENLPHSTFGGHAILRFLKQSDAFFQVLSTRSRAYLLENGFRPEQIVHLPNGVDIYKFQPLARPDVQKAERDILCVSRLEYPKGVDVLLHAWGRMMHAPDEWRRHLKPRLRIVGQGIFKPQMERIVAELGIQDSVEFLGLRRDVVDLLQRSWGFVLPSRWEGMPNALLEAMACGLPCVATRVSGSEDIVTDGVNGLLVAPEEPQAMAEALRQLIENEALMEQLAREARTTIVRDYQIRTIAERSLRLYQHLLTRNQSPLPLTIEDRGEL